MKQPTKPEEERDNIVELEFAVTAGKHLFFAKNQNAKEFVVLKGQRKSLNKLDLQAIKRLGFELKIEARQYEVPEGLE